jgi:hypothetical protein
MSLPNTYDVAGTSVDIDAMCIEARDPRSPAQGNLHCRSTILELSGIQPLALNGLPRMAATADAAAMQWYQHKCSAYVKVEPNSYTSGPSVEQHRQLGHQR